MKSNQKNIKSTVKKNRSSSTRKKTTRRRKSKKVKYVSLDKVLVFCLSVIAICALIYFFSDYIKLKNKVNFENQKESNVEKVELKVKEKKNFQNDKNVELIKKTESTKKTESVKSVKKSQTEKLKSQEKSVEQSLKKSENLQKSFEISKNVAVQSSVPSVEKIEKKFKFDFPPIPWANKNATLVFVFDDAGQNINQLELLLNLPFDISVAVLPKLKYSKKSAQMIRSAKKEVLLHQPMQSVNLKINPGPGAITPEMNEEEIYSVLFENLSEVGPVQGLNNHEGSLITANAEKISYVMKFASDNGIYFLDSRTNVETKVPYVSRELGYGYFERNVFLDNTKNSSDIIKEIMKGVQIANKKGGAIMIGHVWSAEILSEILKEMYPLLKEKGYIFTTVSKFNGIIRNI